MRVAFEARKLDLKPEEDRACRVRLPSTFADMLDAEGKTVAGCIEASAYKNILAYDRRDLKIPHETMVRCS